MPRLPDVNSLGTVTPVAQPQEVPRAYVRSATLRGEALAGIGDQISRTAMEVGTTVLNRQKQDAEDRDRLAYVTANSTFLQQKVKTEADLEEDPNYQTWSPRYQASLQKTADAQAATITDPVMRAQFEQGAALHIAEGSAQLRTRARGKQQDADKAWVYGTVQANIDTALRSPDEATRSAALGQVNDAIETGVKNGSLDPLEALKFRQAVTEQYAESFVATQPTARDKLALLAPPGSGAPPAPLPADLHPIVAQAAQAHDVPAADLERMLQIESGGRNIPASPGHRAAGVAQFMPDTARAYGVDPNNVPSSIDGAARLWADNRAQLRKDLGREPTGAEVYLAHQQGSAGANALIQNPDSKAATVTAPENILGNGGTPDMTAKQFVDMWTGRFNNAPPTERAIVPAGTPDGHGLVPGQPDAAGRMIFAKTGTPIDFLPPGKRAQMYEQALAEQRAEDARAKAEAEQQRQAARVALGSQVDDNLASIRDSGKPVTQVTQAQLAGAFTPLEVEKINRQTNRETDFWAARQQVGLASPQEEQTLLDATKPQGEGYADQAKNRDLLLQAIQAKHQLLAKDPAGYVMQASPDIAQAMRDGFTDPTKMRSAVRSLDGAYDRLGVPMEHREVLSEDTAKALVEQLRSSPPGDLGNTINQMAQQYGSDVWPRVLGSMVREGKLPAAYEVVAAVNDPVARGALVEGLADPEKVRAAVPKNDLKTIDNIIETDPDLHRLAASFAYAPGGAEKMGEIKQAVSLMAYRLTPRNSPDAAVKTAIASITTGKYEFLEDGDFVARVPVGHMADVEARTVATIEGLKAADLMPLDPSVAVPQLTAGQRQDVALAAAQRGHWVTNESETGLLRLNEAGKPVMLKGDRAHPTRRLEVFFGDAVPAPDNWNEPSPVVSP